MTEPHETETASQTPGQGLTGRLGSRGISRAGSRIILVVRAVTGHR